MEKGSLWFKPDVRNLASAWQRSHEQSLSSMIRNYFNIAFRSILKNKVFAVINVAGLAIGIAASMLIIQYVSFEKSYETFHEKADNIYRLTLDIYNNGVFEVTDCETHARIGPLLMEKSSYVADFVRMYHKDGMVNLKVGSDMFVEKDIYFADSTVFNVFTLPVLHGDTKRPLADPFRAVISESTAKKYFGSSDAVGKSIEVDLGTYLITAVISDLSPNTHLKFSILLSHTTIPKLIPNYDDWNGNNEYTYLLMAPHTNLREFNTELGALSETLKDKIGESRYTAEPIRDIHLHSNKSFEPEANGSMRVVYIMLIISLFIIVIAWVNYINLATARSVERAREVGIRKVVGSSRLQLVLQLLIESLVVNAIAAIIALGLFQVSLPYFQELAGQPVSWKITSDVVLWLLFLMMFAVGSLLSGLYPALVLSGFKPVQVLKGKLRSSAHGQRLRQALVVIQFSATIVLIIGMGTVFMQVKHMRSFDLGLNTSQMLIIKSQPLTNDSITRAAFVSFKSEMIRQSDVERVALSECLPGSSIHELNTSTVLREGASEGSALTMYFFSIDEDFAPTLEMTFAAGRNFEPGSERYAQVIINEEALRRLGFENAEQAVGSKVKFQGNQIDPPVVIGVLRNFHQRSPKEEHLPLLLFYTQETDYFAARLNSKDLDRTVESIKGIWDRVFPNTLFNYYFLDEKFNQQYKAETQFGTVVAIFSGLAVFLACLGLFGLSSYTIVQRTKEIGIRKVLGASITHIVELLSFGFVKVILVAALLSLPVAYMAVDSWLSHYAVRINLHAGFFIIPVIIILLIALITVSIQTIKTAVANPTDSLRQE
jgi:putative ABC transport system permease protein